MPRPGDSPWGDALRKAKAQFGSSYNGANKSYADILRDLRSNGHPSSSATTYHPASRQTSRSTSLPSNTQKVDSAELARRRLAAISAQNQEDREEAYEQYQMNPDQTDQSSASQESTADKYANAPRATQSALNPSFSQLGRQPATIAQPNPFSDAINFLGSLFVPQKAYAEETQPEQEQQQQPTQAEQYSSQYFIGDNGQLFAPNGEPYAGTIREPWEFGTVDSEAGAAADALGKSASVENSAGQEQSSSTDNGDPYQPLYDAEGNELNLDEVDELTAANALLRETFGDEANQYDTLTGLQTDATEDEWRRIMTDYRTAPNFLDVLSAYAPEDQREFLSQNIMNLNEQNEDSYNAEAARLVADAFQNLWDTQKQWNIDDLVDAQSDELLNQYSKVFDAAGAMDFADWMSYQGNSDDYDFGYQPYLEASGLHLLPELSDWNASEGIDGGRIALVNPETGETGPASLSDVLKTGSLDPGAINGQSVYDDSVNQYNEAILNAYAPYANLEDKDGYFSDNEIKQAIRDTNKYVQGIRLLQSLNGDKDLAEAMGINQDWVQDMFVLDPSTWFDEDYVKSEQGQNNIRDNVLWPEEIDNTDFLEENPYYGNYDEGDLSFGTNTVDLDALKAYTTDSGTTPLAGLDRLLIPLGYSKAIDTKTPVLDESLKK